MPKFLSQEWLDLQQAIVDKSALNAGGGISGSVQFAVSGSPDGEIKYFYEIQDGALTRSEVGTCDNPDVTVTSTWNDVVAVSKGELDPSVGFMQGRIKVAGDMQLVLALLPLTSGSGSAELRKELQEATEY